MTLPELLRHFDIVKQRPNGGAQARCPAHDDKAASLSIDPANNGGIVIRCFAGCTPESIVAAAGLIMADLMPPRNEAQAAPGSHSVREKPRIVATYPYVDAAGTMLYEVVRYVPKDFRQRRPDPDKPGAYLWNLNAIKRVLYHLCEVKEAIADARRVYLVEGEKDADNLRALGLIATTNAGGASKWEASFTETLRGAKTIILPDDDEPGRKHAALVAAALSGGVAASVRVLELPATMPNGKPLPPKGDVSDWLAAGGTIAELEALADAAPLWTPPKESPEGSAAPPKFRRTEGGLAERFVFEHGDNLRYDHSRLCWFVWDGRRWKADADGAAQEKVKQTIRGVYAEAGRAADEETRAALAKHAIEMDKARAVRGVLMLASTDPKIAVTPEVWDADKYLLNCRNGVIDLRSGCLRPHNRGDLITRLCPVDFDPEAKAPLWESCLQRWQPDPDVRDFLQRAAGYSLTGDIGEHSAFFLFGDGRNGKGVFTRALLHVLGDYAGTLRISVLMESRRGDAGGVTPDLVDLPGKRLVIASEVDEGHRFNEAFVKDVTGGDRISVNPKNAKVFSFLPQFKLWFFGNHKPTIRGSDAGIWSRFPLVPFSVTIPEEERDPALDAKLTAEAAGILTWAVIGCIHWRRARLNPPAAVAAATAQYRKEQDTFGQFVADCCVLSPNAWTPSGALREAYDAFMQERGDRATLNGNQFAERLQRVGVTTGRRRVGGKIVRCWEGIGIVTDDPASQNDATVNTVNTVNTETDMKHRVMYSSDYTENAVHGVHGVHTPPSSDADEWEEGYLT